MGEIIWQSGRDDIGECGQRRAGACVCESASCVSNERRVCEGMTEICVRTERPWLWPVEGCIATGTFLAPYSVLLCLCASLSLFPSSC